MCRFAAYLGPEIRVSSLVTEPSNSIIHQSFKARMREEPLNGDGFGVVWYPSDLEESPARFRAVTPAWNDENLRHLARVISSRCVFAHVRAATQGLAVQQSNCHPFLHGPLAFMHNGNVDGFSDMRRALLAQLSDHAFSMIRGTTDSEHVFGLFVDAWHAEEARPPRERLVRALAACVSQVEALRAQEGVPGETLLNLAVSDGHALATVRYTSGLRHNTLFAHQGREMYCEDGEYGMHEPGAPGAALICSEPLSDDDAWVEVKLGQVVSTSLDEPLRFEHL